MAAGELPGLFARIAVDDTGLQEGLRRAQQELGNFRAHLNKAGVNLVKFGSAATAAGAALSIAITRSAASAGKEIANLSRVSGAGIVEFQKYAAASQTVGIEQEKLGDIFKDVRDRIGDFIQTGGGPMADFFERIAPQVGVTAEQFRKLSGPQALQLFVDSMEKAGLTANEMAFQMEAMASDTTALLPLLKNGGQVMREIGDEAERSGRILSEMDVSRLQLAAQQMAEFDQTVGTLKNQLGAQLAPILAGIGKLLEDAAIEAGGFGNLVGESMNTAIDAAGFVADAIHGIKVAFQTVADGIIIGASGLAVALTEPFVQMTDLLSHLPGDAGEAFTELNAQVSGFSNTAKGVVLEAMDAIDARLTEPLPSEGLKKWVGDVQSAADEAARTMSERLAEAQGGAGLATFDTEEQDKAAAEAAAKHQQELTDRIERIRQANLTESELMKEKYANDALALQEARMAGLEIEGGFDQQLLDLKKNHEDALGQLEQEALDKRLNMERQAAQARLSALQGALSTVSSLMNSENRKMFEIGKAAAIAQSIINTYQGVSEAWKLGPILGPPLAALVATAGFANVANIRKQSFGGGGGGAAGVAGAGTAGLASAQTPGVGIQGNQQQSQTMFVQGINPTDIFTGEQLVSIINTAQENGAVLRTS